MIDYSTRLTQVQQKMGEEGIDLLFLSPGANLRYLTGIPREEPNFGNTIYPGEWLTGAWIPADGRPILTLPRMLAQFHMGGVEGHDVRILPDAEDPKSFAGDVLDALSISGEKKIAVEDRAWAEAIDNLRSLRPDATFSLASEILMPLRRIKSSEEIELMRRAGEITEAAFEASRSRLRHGMTNLDLITEVNYQLKLNGSTTHSFVTSFYNMGPDYPFDFTNREEVLLVPLEPPVAVSYDFGAVFEGYCYDFGRSVFFGDPGDEYRRVYELVMTAQQAGIEALRQGNRCCDADSAARQVIEEGGYGEAFMHRLGHAIGLDVHESPFLTAEDKTPLEPGMCFTAEPSIFIPHRFGARVEDVVVVGEERGIPLTSGFQQLHVVE